jgi:hypothetical protein
LIKYGLLMTFIMYVYICMCFTIPKRSTQYM